jgi:hypothetical protein
MKYSKGFERDYQFYLSNLDKFNFCGTLNPNFEAIINGELSAKECFFFIESQGKNYPCSEPLLLNKLLLCKAGINFQIKQWAEARQEGTLPLVEFSKNAIYSYYPDKYKEQPDRDELERVGLTLEWVNEEPIYHRDIQTQYGLPDWVIDAVENQCTKLRRNKLKAA